MRGHFPLNLGWQASTRPAAPGIGLPPAHVHGRLIAQHAPGRTKTGLHDRAAGHTNLLDIARAATPLCAAHLLQPVPAAGLPELGPVIPAVINKLDKLGPADGLGVDLELGYPDLVRAQLVVKSKTCAGRTAQLPDGGRHQHGLAQRHGGGCEGLQHGFVQRQPQRLRGVGQRFGMHVFVKQAQPVEVQGRVVVARFFQQLQRAFQGVKQVGATCRHVG